MAAVLEQLQTQCYEFEMNVRTGDGANTSAKGMVLEPGRMRLEQRGGLGAITSIIDNDAGQSLILFERFKAAYQFDREEAKEIGVLSFLILPKRSIEDLWSLQVGDETALGKKNIGGKPAEGFRVMQNDKEYTQTITVWAVAKTGQPLKVEIVQQSNEDEKAILKLMLSDFRVIPEPNKALFSTKTPATYTLANKRTLEQIKAEYDTTTSTAQDTTAQAKKVLNAIALWADGKKQESAKLILAVNWSDDIRFVQEHHLFTMTEQQYISLLFDDQKKVMTGIMIQSSQCRAIARELVALGRKARISKDFSKAEKYFSTTMHWGRLLDHNRDTMLIVRLVGIAIQEYALTELALLYEELGETEKLQNTQAQINHIQKQVKDIKKSVSGR